MIDVYRMIGRLRQLMQDVQDKVKAQFGVMLEPEVKMLGEF